MKFSLQIKDIVTEELLHEIRRGIKSRKIDFQGPLVLDKNEGIAIFADEGLNTNRVPFVACVRIPIPLSIDEAKYYYTSWQELEWERTWESYSVQRNNKEESFNLSSEDVKNEFFDFTFEQLAEGEANENIKHRICTFWVAQLKKQGVSFEEQVRRNQEHVVTGHFIINDLENNCHVISNEIGHRMHYEDE